MARTAATTKTAPAVPAPTPAALSKPVAKPVMAKTETKAAPPAKAAPVTAAATAAPVADKPEGEIPVTTPSAFEEVSAKIVAVTAIFKELQTMLKALSKEHDKLKKTVEKSERKRANARNNPNGFAKPTKIVDELCDFCGVPRDTKMSRTDVTRHINSYIKEHNLNKPENKRVIIPDDKLRALLKLKQGDEVNYFKMQSYISPLFIKETPVA